MGGSHSLLKEIRRKSWIARDVFQKHDIEANTEVMEDTSMMGDTLI